jgi:outer membrane murein-binding lipoprotein Lpp
MKQWFSLLIAVVVCTAFAAGCASRPVSSVVAAKSADLPDWYENPPEDESQICGIGSAKMGSESRTQKAAEHRSRVSIAQQLQAQVDALTEDYTREAGGDEDPAALNYFAEVSRALSSQALSDARIIKRWKRSDGTLFVLAEYSREKARSAARNVVNNPESRVAEAEKEIMINKMDDQLAARMKPISVETAVPGE